MSKEEKEFSFYFRGESMGVMAESLEGAYGFMYSEYGCTEDELDEAYERGNEPPSDQSEAEELLKEIHSHFLSQSGDASTYPCNKIDVYFKERKV